MKYLFALGLLVACAPVERLLLPEEGAAGGPVFAVTGTTDSTVGFRLGWTAVADRFGHPATAYEWALAGSLGAPRLDSALASRTVNDVLADTGTLRRPPGFDTLYLQASVRGFVGDSVGPWGRSDTLRLYASAGSIVVDTLGPPGAPDVTLDTLPPLPPPVVGTLIAPGESIQAAVDAQPAGATFTLAAGIHRLQVVRPKDGNTFLGQPGAVLSGARLLTQFVREGTYWVATGQTQQGPTNGECTVAGCNLPEDLYLDDTPLLQVLSLAAVVPGKWFFDYAADRVYFADDPTGRRVEITDTRRAFEATANNVTIRGLVIEKYANPAQSGAVHMFLTGTATVSGWTVEDCEIRWNHGAGIAIGAGARVLRNNVHHNGQLGVAAHGAGALIERNEIAHNNTMGFSSGWEAGGSKFAFTSGLVVRGNHVHHNQGPGLWTDIDNIDVLYEGNVVTDNARIGIFHEISYAAVIRSNVVERNGFDPVGPGWLYGAGILVAHSPNVEVVGNTVRDNKNGIAGIQQNRGSGAFGPYRLENLWVHDNVVVMAVGLTGVAQDVGDNTVFTGRNNRFDRNMYCLTPARPFAWLNADRTATEWQTFGQDVNGTFTSC